MKAYRLFIEIKNISHLVSCKMEITKQALFYDLSQYIKFAFNLPDNENGLFATNFDLFLSDGIDTVGYQYKYGEMLPSKLARLIDLLDSYEECEYFCNKYLFKITVMEVIDKYLDTVTIDDVTGVIIPIDL